MHNTGGHSYEAKVRFLDDMDNGLDILQLAYMDHTMGMVIMLPRVKTNTWQATKSWRPRNLLAATPLLNIVYWLFAPTQKVIYSKVQLDVQMR